MKRLVTILLALVMLIPAALGEIDLTSFSDQELLDLRSALDAEIASRSLVQADFFASDERYTEFNDLMLTCDFDELQTMLSSYIKDYQPGPEDSVFKLMTSLESILAYSDITERIVDDFDGSATIRFKDCEAISEDVCVAPFIEGPDARVRFGFVKKGWLFFDGIAISADGKVIFNNTEYRSYDPDQEIIEGGVISEIAASVLPEDRVFYVVLEKSQKCVIRFSCFKSGEHFDHTLTDTEKAAIVAAYRIDSLMDDMYRVRNQHRKKHK